jgi:hypothetical protein
MTKTEVDSRPYSSNGCCADRKDRDELLASGKCAGRYLPCCDASTCMKLDEGKSCADCKHERTCREMFGGDPKNTNCQWFPRRFLQARNLPVVESGR